MHQNVCSNIVSNLIVITTFNIFYHYKKYKTFDIFNRTVLRYDYKITHLLRSKIMYNSD